MRHTKHDRKNTTGSHWLVKAFVNVTTDVVTSLTEVTYVHMYFKQTTTQHNQLHVKILKSESLDSAGRFSTRIEQNMQGLDVVTVAIDTYLSSSSKFETSYGIIFYRNVEHETSSV
jgi:hypothetical protein